MNKKSKKLVLFFLAVVMVVFIGYLSRKINFNPFYAVGEKIDEFNGVSVFYNGGVDNVEERNLSENGYNIGLKYQCVEFVKRYYLKVLNHKMPNAYGHAKDFYNSELADGEVNLDRGLIQFNNKSTSKPMEHDIIIFKESMFNPYGHVAIVTKVHETEIEIIQQNPGPFGRSRERFELVLVDQKWWVKEERVLGWLRKNTIMKSKL